MSITFNDPQDDPTYFNFSEFCNDADFCNDLSDCDPVPKGDGIADFAGRHSTAPSTPLSSERRDNMGAMSHSPSIVPSPGYSNGPLDSAVIVPKVGSRFSKAVIRMLKDWLACHTHFPYPTEPELAALQSETGLNKTQITNWFANARRRGLVQSARPTPFQAKDSPTNPMDIPS
ncbi:Homeobox domain [Fusarium oxysporum f. sp. vasinfectum]|nr:Homeobox domain [Fusarium oxysporum f. sp. vasinfectum]